MEAWAYLQLAEGSSSVWHEQLSPYQTSVYTIFIFAVLGMLL